MIVVDRASGHNLYHQLYVALRDSILSGAAPRGAVLPSTRTLSEDLSISRSTVSSVFEQLAAEGLIETKIGSGTRVTEVIPDDFQKLIRQRQKRAIRKDPIPLRLPDRARLLTTFTDTRAESQPRPFTPGVPALDQFPIDVWVALASRRWKAASARELCSSAAAGSQELRCAIATHAGVVRAAMCKEDNVVVVSGAQQALDLCARVLAAPGDVCWIEDPGYLGARHAFALAGMKLIPATVDEYGLDVERAIATLAQPRLIYVTPSHQYPLGGTLALERRIALLQYAERVGAWIVEDDYDSEFGYAGTPISCLQGLDVSDRVIYIGSFNKTLFPGLRLGFAIVPADLIAPFQIARLHSDGHPPAVSQTILAEFLISGAYSSHIRRMRTVYMERRNLLLELIETYLPELVIGIHDRGLHFVGYLPPGIEDAETSRLAKDHGVIVPPLSQFYLSDYRRSGLLFGFACTLPFQMEPAIRKLASAVQRL